MRLEGGLIMAVWQPRPFRGRSLTILPATADASLHAAVRCDQVVVDHDEVLELWVHLQAKKHLNQSSKS